MSTSLIFNLLTAIRATHQNEIVMVDRTEMITTCETGFQYNSEEECCIKNVEETPSLTCSGTGIMDSNGKCVCVTDALKTCPDGARRTAYGCSEKLTIAPTVKCDHLGTYWAEDVNNFGQCTGIKYHKPHFKCPDSYFHFKPKDNLCAKKVVDSANEYFTCANGWDLINLDQCVRTEEVKCTGHEEIVANVNHVEDHNRKLCAHCSIVVIETACDLLECKEFRRKKVKKGKDHTFIEKQTEAEVPEVCYREAIVPAKKKCLDGKLFNGECWDYETVDAVPHCHHGVLTADLQCSRDVSKPGIYKCGEGYKLKCKSGHCECRKDIMHDFTLQCPEGYSLLEQACVRMTEAELYCPNDNSVLVDDRCYSVERSGIIYEYTVTYQQQGECMETDTCEKTIRKRAKRVE